jgi:uncharacterized protein (DUF2147 family)
MWRRYSLGILFLLAISFSFHVHAQHIDPLERNLWYNQEKTAKIQFFKAADNKLYGKVAWLKKPEIDGKVKVDKRNPDVNRRNDPILGLVILKGFVKDGDNEYEDGTVYDPSSGRTYSAKMTYKGDKLDVRGYYGISLIGKTQEWTRAD